MDILMPREGEHPNNPPLPEGEGRGEGENPNRHNPRRHHAGHGRSFGVYGYLGGVRLLLVFQYIFYFFNTFIQIIFNLMTPYSYHSPPFSSKFCKILFIPFSSFTYFFAPERC